MVWMHLEAQRTGGGELPLGRSLEAFAGGARPRRRGARRADRAPLRVHGVAGGLGLPHRHPHEARRRPGASPRRAAPRGVSRSPPRGVPALPARAQRHVPELLDPYLRKCYTRGVLPARFHDAEHARDAARRVPDAHALSDLLRSVGGIGAAPGAARGKSCIRSSPSPPRPSRRSASCFEFRDQASTDQLMAFTLETKYLFDERRACRHGLSFGL